METGATASEEMCAGAGTASTPSTPVLPTRKSHQKRKRRSSGGPWEGKHGGRGPRRTPHKKAKMPVSSTRAANNIMKFRLGGSVSDPLNLAGGDDVADNCSTCAPSPATPLHGELEPPDLPPQLLKDPLNLEGKVKNFPLLTAGAKIGGSGRGLGPPAGLRKKPRRRTTSGSKPDSSSSGGDTKKREKQSRFVYGNYNRYYGYRNEGGVNEVDPRLCLLEKEWFQDKQCLDIGCNTGQVTMTIAKDFHPHHILGVDIDQSLIQTAWKNITKLHVPSATPDGRSFPCSFTMSRGMLSPHPMMLPGFQTSRRQHVPKSSLSQDSAEFPYNISFKQMNYVPASEDLIRSQVAEYDVILALSLTKWVHLNWGDAGLKRFFQKVYAHLRPGGRFILEPQSYGSYHKRKKLTETIHKNYQGIQFYPSDFHDYLMSSEVGFSHYLYLGTSSNKAKGFQRPIHVYIKSSPSLSSSDPSSCKPHPTSCEPHPPAGQRRLKSVVVVCPTNSSSQPHPSSPASLSDRPHPPPLFPNSNPPHLPGCHGDQHPNLAIPSQSENCADEGLSQVTMEMGPPVTMETGSSTCDLHSPADTTTLCCHDNSGTKSLTDT